MVVPPSQRRVEVLLPRKGAANMRVDGITRMVVERLYSPSRSSVSEGGLLRDRVVERGVLYTRPLHASKFFRRRGLLRLLLLLGVFEAPRGESEDGQRAREVPRR